MFPSRKAIWSMIHAFKFDKNIKYLQESDIDDKEW